MTPATFRFSLLASVVIGLAGGLIDFVVPGLVPANLMAEALQHDQVTSGLGLLLFGVLILGSLVGGLVAVVGLWLFRQWARPLALVATVAGVLLAPMVGVSVTSGWAFAASIVSSTLWGAALAAAYFSPLGDRFHRGGR